MLALVYRRVSTGGQDNSIAAQERANDAVCAANNWTVQNYEDRDTSGSLPLSEREGGARLITALRKCNPSTTVVVTANQDRIGRDTPDVISNIRLMWETGITPFFTLEGGHFPRSSQNEFLLTVKAGASNYELNRLRERTTFVLRDKRTNGELYGTVPYGWDAVYTFADGHQHRSSKALFWGGKRGQSGAQGLQPPDELPAELLAEHGALVSKKLEPNGGELGWVAWLFLNRYPQWPALEPTRFTMKELAAALNQLGIPAKLGGKWNWRTIDGLLHSQQAIAWWTTEALRRKADGIVEV